MQVRCYPALRYTSRIRYHTGILTNGPSLLIDRSMHRMVVKIYFDLSALEVQVPVRDTHKQASSDNISQGRRDHGFPDIVSDRDVFRALEDRKGDKEHVRDDVVGADADEAHDGEPYSEDLGEDLAGGDREEDGHGNKPICKDATEEYLVPAWCHNLRGGESKDFLLVGGRFKNTAI